MKGLTKMKKSVTLLALATVVTLTACGGNARPIPEVTTIETIAIATPDLATEIPWEFEEPGFDETYDNSSSDIHEPVSDFTIELADGWNYENLYGMYTATRGDAQENGAMLTVITIGVDNIDGIFAELLDEINIDEMEIDEFFPGTDFDDNGGMLFGSMFGMSGANGTESRVVGLEKTTIDSRPAAKVVILLELMGREVEATMYMLTDETGLYIIAYYELGEVDYSSEFEEMVKSFRTHGISDTWYNFVDVEGTTEITEDWLDID